MSRTKPPQNPSPAISNTDVNTKSTIDIAALTARHAYKYAELQRTAQRLLSGYDDSKSIKAGGEDGRGVPAAERMVKDGEGEEDDDDDSELWNVEDETAGLGTSKPTTTSTTTATATSTSTAVLRRKLLGTKRSSHHTLTPRPALTGSIVPEKRSRPGQGRGGRDGRAVDDDSSEEEGAERKGRPRHAPTRTTATVNRKRGLQSIQHTTAVSASHEPRPEHDKGDEHDDDHIVVMPATVPPTSSDPDLRADGEEENSGQDQTPEASGKRGTHDNHDKNKTAAGGGARYLDVLLAERAAAKKKKKKKRRKKGERVE